MFPVRSDTINDPGIILRLSIISVSSVMTTVLRIRLPGSWARPQIMKDNNPRYSTTCRFNIPSY